VRGDAALRQPDVLHAFGDGVFVLEQEPASTGNKCRSCSANGWGEGAPVLIRCTLRGMDPHAVHVELERARATFHELLDGSCDADLHRRSNGTRWTNQQLLFHMLLGYLIVRALGVLVRVFGRLPVGASWPFAWLLNSATKPFDVINYLGSCMGGAVLSPQHMGALFDRVVAALHRRLDAEDEADLARGMYYPTRWDPFFRNFMTLADVYHFPTQHFDFHRRQLTLGEPQPLRDLDEGQ